MGDKRIVIRASEENKRTWKRLCNEIDPDASYEEVVEALGEYFEEDEGRIGAVRRIARDERPHFRGPD